MSTPKRHHYLPQSYLENFTNELGMVWVCDKENNTFNKQSPHNTGVIKNYYSIKLEDGTFDTRIEKALADIDGLFITIFNKFKTKAQLTSQEKFDMSACLAFLYTRTPKFQKDYELTTNKAIKEILKITQNEETVKRTLKEIGQDPSQAKNVVKFIQDEKYDIVLPREESLRLMVEMAPKLQPAFNMYDWTVFKAHHEYSFITSDNPVIMMPPKNYSPNSFHGIGFLTPGVSFFLPLSSKLLLCMKSTEIPHKDIQYLSLGKEDMRNINRDFFNTALRFVIGRDKPLLEKLHQLNKTEDIQDT